MTQTQHTPGPWRLGDHLKEEKSRCIAEINGIPKSKNVCKRNQDNTERQILADVFQITGDQAKANARLISAAPDMYEALEWAEDEIASYAPDPSFRSQITYDVLQKIRLALAKARGQS